MNPIKRDMYLALLRIKAIGEHYAFAGEDCLMKAVSVRDCGVCFCVLLVEVLSSSVPAENVKVPFWVFHDIMVEWRIDTSEP